MYIYELILWSKTKDGESYCENEYIASNKLYSPSDFKYLCNQIIEKLKEDCVEIANKYIVQQLILKYGFQALNPTTFFLLTSNT